VSTHSLEDGNRSSSRNVVFSSFHNIGRRTKSKNPVILIPSTCTISIWRQWLATKYTASVRLLIFLLTSSVRNGSRTHSASCPLGTGIYPRSNLSLAAHLSCTDVIKPLQVLQALLHNAALTTSVTSYADVHLFNQQRFEQSASVNPMFHLCDKLRRLSLSDLSLPSEWTSVWVQPPADGTHSKGLPQRHGERGNCSPGWSLDYSEMFHCLPRYLHELWDSILKQATAHSVHNL
jgi:hypothetical protein